MKSATETDWALMAQWCTWYGEVHHRKSRILDREYTREDFGWACEQEHSDCADVEGGACGYSKPETHHVNLDYEARAWLEDCGADPDDLDTREPEELVEEVHRQYEGGWPAFMKSFGLTPPNL